MLIFMQNLKNISVCGSAGNSEIKPYFQRLTLHLWLYVNVGTCASVVLIVITWFMSDALKIPKIPERRVALPSFTFIYSSDSR